jgi:hypothetical protein
MGQMPCLFEATPALDFTGQTNFSTEADLISTRSVLAVASGLSIRTRQQRQRRNEPFYGVKCRAILTRSRRKLTQVEPTSPRRPT